MTDPPEPRPRPSPRLVLVAGILVVVAFLTGFGWQFLEARSARSERDAIRMELTLQALGTTLASAALQAEYGGFERARELMSEFFTGLQTNLESAPADGREVLRAILDRRDAVITGLSRREEATRRELARLHVRYQTALGQPIRSLPLSDAAEPGGPDVPRDTVGGR